MTSSATTPFAPTAAAASPAAPFDETLSVLVNMFCPLYNHSQLSSILRHHGGNADRTIERILSHQATGSSPDSLMRQLELETGFSRSSSADASSVRSAPPRLCPSSSSPQSSVNEVTSGTKQFSHAVHAAAATPVYKSMPAGPDGGAGVRLSRQPTGGADDSFKSGAAQTARHSTAPDRGEDPAAETLSAATAGGLNAVMGGLSDEQRELLSLLRAEKERRRNTAPAAGGTDITVPSPQREEQPDHNSTSTSNSNDNNNSGASPLFRPASFPDLTCPPPSLEPHAISAPVNLPSGPGGTNNAHAPEDFAAAQRRFVTDGASLSSESSGSFAPTHGTMLHMHTTAARSSSTATSGNGGWRGEARQLQQPQLPGQWRQPSSQEGIGAEGLFHDIQQGRQHRTSSMPSPLRHTTSEQPQEVYRQQALGHNQHHPIPTGFNGFHPSPAPVSSAAGTEQSFNPPPMVSPPPLHRNSSMPSPHQTLPDASTKPRVATTGTLCPPTTSLGRAQSDSSWNSASTKSRKQRVDEVLRREEEVELNKAIEASMEDSKQGHLPSADATAAAQRELEEAMAQSLKETDTGNELEEAMARSLTEMHESGRRDTLQRRMSESDLEAATLRLMQQSREHAELARASSMMMGGVAQLPSLVRHSSVPENDVLDDEEQLKKALEASIAEQTGGYRRQREELRRPVDQRNGGGAGAARDGSRGREHVISPPSKTTSPSPLMASAPPPIMMGSPPPLMASPMASPPPSMASPSPPPAAATLRSAEAPPTPTAASPRVPVTIQNAEAPSIGQDVIKSVAADEDGFLTVKGCGIDAINGTFEPSGVCNGVKMYAKEGTWKNRTVTFTLYRCWLSSSDRKWFISIVPDNCTPGTDQDTDFYCAPGTTNFSLMENELPPESGWTCVGPYGQGPPPMCLFETVPLSEEAEHDFISVEGAGTKLANGAYRRLELHDGVGTYGREAFWNGVKVTFTVFRMALGGSEGRMWFMSIVPTGCNAGSNVDTDLYTAESSCRGDDVDCNELPPVDGWEVIPGFGQHPPPRIRVEAAEVVEEEIPLTPPPRTFFTKTKGQKEEIDGPAPPQPKLKKPVPTSPSPPEIAARSKGQSLASGTKAEDHDIARRLSNESDINKNNNSNGKSLRPPSPPPGNTKSDKTPSNETQNWLLITNAKNETQPRRVAMCVVCRVKPVTHVLVPCGHPCLCEDCASAKEVDGLHGRCPIGRCDIKCVMRFYGTLVEDK